MCPSLSSSVGQKNLLFGFQGILKVIENYSYKNYYKVKSSSWPTISHETWTDLCFIRLSSVAFGRVRLIYLRPVEFVWFWLGWKSFTELSRFIELSLDKVGSVTFYRVDNDCINLSWIELIWFWLSLILSDLIHLSSVGLSYVELVMGQFHLFNVERRRVELRSVLWSWVELRWEKVG